MSAPGNPDFVGPVRRSDAVMVMRLMGECGAGCIPLPEQLARAAPYIAASLAKSTNERMRARGAELIGKIAAHKLRVYALAEMIARLQNDRQAGVPDTPPDEINLREAARRDPEILKALFDIRGQRERDIPPPSAGGA